MIGLTAALLSACNVPLGNNASTGNAGAAANNITNAVPPLNQTNMVMPGGEEDAGGGNASAGASEDDVGGGREAMLASCTREAGAALPQGTDVARLCGCAVDRALAGARRSDAMRQCATEQNVQLPRPQ
jgi:hypothetical protein